jgi:hypothetical protein
VGSLLQDRCLTRAVYATAPTDMRFNVVYACQDNVLVEDRSNIPQSRFTFKDVLAGRYDAGAGPSSWGYLQRSFKKRFGELHDQESDHAALRKLRRKTR